MNTIRAILLPCAGTAGGVPAQPSAAGRPITVCGKPERGGGGHEDHRAASRTAAAAVNYPAGVVATVHRKLAGYRLAGLRAVGRDHRVHPRRGPANQTARMKSRRPFGAGNRLPGSLSVQLRQKSRYVRCPFTHEDFLSAPELQSQHGRKDRQGVEKRPQELVRQGQGDE